MLIDTFYRKRPVKEMALLSKLFFQMIDYTIFCFDHVIRHSTTPCFFLMHLSTDVILSRTTDYHSLCPWWLLRINRIYIILTKIQNI